MSGYQVMVNQLKDSYERECREKSFKEADTPYKKMFHFLKYYGLLKNKIFTAEYLESNAMFCPDEIWVDMDNYFHAEFAGNILFSDKAEKLNIEFNWVSILTYEGLVSELFRSYQNSLKTNLTIFALDRAKEYLSREIDFIDDVCSEI